MRYVEAIEAAGAEVICSKFFGSYQGDWIAKIKTQDNQIKYVISCFGSCSYCDAFENEFGDVDYTCNGEDYYDPISSGEFRNNCDKCQKIKKRFVDFGKSYIELAYTFEECLLKASEDIEWDEGSRDIVEWLNNNK